MYRLFSTNSLLDTTFCDIINIMNRELLCLYIPI